MWVHRAEAAGRVIADVQAELQQMGYYQGEVDGLLGRDSAGARRLPADQGLTRRRRSTSRRSIPSDELGGSKK